MKRGGQTTSDIVVVGGGAIGAALSYGLAKHGKSVTILDEGDDGFRAARGNAGLIWYQLKGLGFQEYSEICLEATQQWDEFAKELQCNTDIDLHYSKTGGVEFSRSDAEYRKLGEEIEQFRKQSSTGQYDSELIDRQTLQGLMPKLQLGQHVVGGAYSPHDGQVYTPALLQALHKGFQSLGGRYLPNSKVTDIASTSAGFQIKAGDRAFSTGKVVLAAGLGLAKLGEFFGLSVPIRPQRGQVIVTERMPQMLNHPAAGIRQTPAGNFLLGASKEWAGHDESVTPEILKKLATKWVETIPQFKHVNMIRSWGALRPMMPDGAPVYQRIDGHPGAYVLTSHSGISLASINAGRIAKWVADDGDDPGLDAFGLGRFEKSEGSACSKN